MCCLKVVFLALLLTCSAGAIPVEDGEQLREAVASLATPGPNVVWDLSGSLSIADAGPAPTRVARNVTLRGAGPPNATEISLYGWVSMWQLAPGVVVTLENLTLSNLALRPPDAPTPPPSNLSVFTFPLWFFETNR
jgi:hypothetical protein